MDELHFDTPIQRPSRLGPIRHNKVPVGLRKHLGLAWGYTVLNQKAPRRHGTAGGNLGVGEPATRASVRPRMVIRVAVRATATSAVASSGSGLNRVLPVAKRTHTIAEDALASRASSS